MALLATLVRPVGLALLALAAAGAMAADALHTQVLMLTGTGPDDAVPWDFTIHGGRRAGERARIPVPSNWQQQGFGHYQYGYDKGPRAADVAVYSRRVRVPAPWQGLNVRIVFDAVMTDALVRVNGRVAGPVHQGGFNRFSHDVTPWIKPGEDNEIEVEVSEASASPAPSWPSGMATTGSSVASTGRHGWRPHPCRRSPMSPSTPRPVASWRQRSRCVRRAA